MNLYFKILEKINLVLQKVKEFFRNQQTPGGSSTGETAAIKVLYGNSNFIRDLKQVMPDLDDLNDFGGDSPQKVKYQKIMKDVVESNVVIIPFFPD